MHAQHLIHVSVTADASSLTLKQMSIKLMTLTQHTLLGFVMYNNSATVTNLLKSCM